MPENRFPIVEARQELGFTPTTAVRAEGDFSTGEGAVGAAAGEALVAGAKVLQRKSAERLFLETEQIKKLDTNREITANAIISNAETEHEGFKATTADATLWEKDLGERMEKARQQISDLGLLEDTGELVNTKLNARLSVGTKETFKEATLRIIEDAKKAADLNYIEALRSTDEVEIKEAKALWIEAYSGNTTTVDQKLLFTELTRKGFEQVNQDAVEAKRNEAGIDPIGVEAEMKAERELRATGVMTPELAALTGEDLVDIGKFAKSAGAENAANSKRAFDVAIGNAVAGWSTKISDPNTELTEREVWNTPIEVPPIHQAGLGAKREFWAGIARGITARRRQMQEGVNKKTREDAYNPVLAAELKTRARKAESVTDIEKIKEDASQALTRNEIDDTDIETVNFNADKTFDTLADATIDTEEVRYRSIILKGTSTESLVPWLTAQTIAITAAGGEITAEETQELIQQFERAARAKEWAVARPRESIEREIDKAEAAKKTLSVDEIRDLYLKAKKVWLRKSDTDLIKEYDAWLSSKP